MLRIFASTPRYIQGPGALSRIVPTAREFGDRIGMIVDARVLELLRSSLLDGIREQEDKVIAFSGEITLEAVAGLVAAAEGCSVIVGVGGGKALDAGKATALRLGVPVITVPTIASTDAPASRGIAIYDDDHKLALVEQLPFNPATVLVDTSVIASAPVDFLRAGIGDALAKKFEGEASYAASGLNKHGTLPLEAGLIAADGCYRVLRKHGAQAVQEAGIGVATAAIEAVVEAAFLLSALGFENTGLSIAHSVTRGLVKARTVKDAPHGFHVAYGLLVQFSLENRPDAELIDLRQFCRSVGLPVTLAEFGMTDVSGAELDAIARLTMTSPHTSNLAGTVTFEAVRGAIGKVEAITTRI